MIGTIKTDVWIDELHIILLHEQGSGFHDTRTHITIDTDDGTQIHFIADYEELGDLIDALTILKRGL